MATENFLGIDYGTRKVGVALAHAETGVAMAFGVLQNDAQFFGELKRIIAGEAVGTVVVGVPERRPDKNVEHPARAFGQELAKACGVTVVFADEMFTSSLAQRVLRERGETAVASQDDAEAAAILLQDWLDRSERP